MEMKPAVMETIEFEYEEESILSELTGKMVQSGILFKDQNGRN